MAINPVNQAQLNKFEQAYGRNGLTDTELFEVYSAFAIMSGLLSESVDPFDIHLKGCEFGLDGIAILIQDTLVTNRQEAEEALADTKNPSIEFVFFQAKTSAKFDYGDISKFFDGIQGFLDGSSKGESPQLDDLLAAKDEIYARASGKKNPSLKAFFVSLGTYNSPGSTEKLIATERRKLIALNILDNNSIELHMVGAIALQRYYRAATTAMEVKFYFPRNVPMPPNDNVEQAFIGYVSASEVLKLVASFDDTGNVVDINNSVFFDNIRDFDPDSEINKSIIASLQSGQSKDFAFRNNGITVVAKSISRLSDDFTIEDYQIVNGCQTSSIIFYAKEAVGDVSVPLRLIGSKNDDFTSSIIVGTNRQNQVREEQFWALRPFMKNFEEYCAAMPDDERLYYERRENQFRAQNIEKVRIVQPSGLMKAVTATLVEQPNRSSRDFRRIYEENKNILFLDDHDVRVYYASSYLAYRLEFMWRNQKLPPELKIYRYYLMYALSNYAGGGKNVLGMKKAVASAYADALINLAKDEDRVKAFAEGVASSMHDLLELATTPSRERIRDQMRSDTFFRLFKSKQVNI